MSRKWTYVWGCIVTMSGVAALGFQPVESSAHSGHAELQGSVAKLQRPAASDISKKFPASAGVPVSGRIVDPNGNPLQDATVSVIVQGVSESIIASRSDSVGGYKLNVPEMSGVHTLRVIHIGYTPYSVTMQRKLDGWNIPEEIVLRPIPQTSESLGTP